MDPFLQVVGIVLAAREATASSLLGWAQAACDALGVPHEWQAVPRLAAQLQTLRAAAAAATNDTGSRTGSSSSSSSGGGWAGVVWNGLVGSLMLFFLLGTIQEVARQR
jgi:hypothetical protein